MTGDNRDPSEPESSVLGSLPRDRPGTRSPRRPARGAGASGEDVSADRSEPSGDRQPSGERHGVEDLAWAGVAVAAEAATLGVRLANRLFEAGGGRQRPSS